MKIRDADILIITGGKDPGPDHWQSRWAAKMATARLLEHDTRSKQEPDAWVSNVRAAIAAASRPVVLIAHGLGVAACVHAVQGPQGLDIAAKVAGGFFVAPPDLADPDIRSRHRGTFGPYPGDPLPFACFVVASRNDPLSSYEKTTETAADWGAHLIDARDAGHIDTQSGHGPWPEGLMVFATFMKRL